MHDRKKSEELKDHQIRSSLRYSINEAAFTAGTTGFGESFFAAYALFLKATTLQVGLLSALPQAIGSLFQVFSNALIRRFGSRKRLVIWAAALQALMFIPVALVFFFGRLRIPELIFFASIYWVSGMLLTPSWNSWMGDLVDQNRRGSFFSRRSKVTGTTTFIALLISGYILQRFAGSDAKTQYLGFLLIFSIAFISRIISIYFLARQYEPPYTVSREAEFGFFDFLIRKEFRNFRTFVLFLGLMNFGVFLSSPFFTPYMLNDLKLDYLTFTVVNASAIIAKILSLPVWGWATDRFGSRRILKLAGFMMPLVPILWIVSRETAWLVALQAYSGFVWAGFEIATISFIFDTTIPAKRATCIAYYNAVTGFSLISGALAGGLIVRMNSVFWSKYLFVFLISGILRFAASFFLLGKLKEEREVERIGYPSLFFKVLSNVPTRGLLYEFTPFQGRRKE